MAMYKQVSRQEKLSAQVAGQIEDLYRQGELETGTRLPSERELCETFGVSRTVIREAIHILATRGLLQTQSGSGTYVQAVSLDKVEHMLSLYFSNQSAAESIAHAFEFRVFLEVHIVQIAAERRQEENIQNLEAIIDGMAKVLDDPDAYSLLDADFHIELARSTQNPMFELFLKPNRALIRSMISYSNTLPDRPKLSMEAHREILAAVKRKDVQQAGESMHQHLEQYRTMSLSQ